MQNSYSNQWNHAVALQRTGNEENTFDLLANENKY